MIPLDEKYVMGTATIRLFGVAQLKYEFIFLVLVKPPLILQFWGTLNYLSPRCIGGWGAVSILVISNADYSLLGVILCICETPSFPQKNQKKTFIIRGCLSSPPAYA